MKRSIIVLLAFFALIYTPAALAVSSQVNDQTIKVIHPDQGKILALGNDLMTFKNQINPDDSRDISLMVVTHPAGEGGAPLHTNPPEYFYILSSEFEFFGNHPVSLVKASAGDIIQVKSSTPHGYKHTGNETGEMLVITAPDWLEEYFDELGTPVKERSVPANSKEPSMEKTIAAGKRHEIIYLK